MTTTTSTQIATTVASRYADLKFAPLAKKPDTSKNKQRGARKSKIRTIL